MQMNFFCGRVASAPTLTHHGETTVCRVRLLSNEYAGKEESSGEAQEVTVGLNFTAFASRAKAIAENCLEGDELKVFYKIRNHEYEKNGEPVYGYNFIVTDFEFGAPGAKKREQLAKRG